MLLRTAEPELLGAHRGPVAAHAKAMPPTSSESSRSAAGCRDRRTDRVSEPADLPRRGSEREGAAGARRRSTESVRCEPAAHPVACAGALDTAVAGDRDGTHVRSAD